jgi:negative regulator of flagellin synthesis FlgM
MQVTDKVADSSQIKALSPSKAVEPGRVTAAEHGETSGDRVSTEASLKVSEVVSQAAAAASAMRSSQLSSIAAQVKLGTYRPNPQVIAQQLLDDAELAAKLQAVFR